ncbi:hypothetical protein J6590_066764 [Homalodisca vitripennis]|nr:hypothetical protein J6590_066764 [Homalodisca vitripennis]
MDNQEMGRLVKEMSMKQYEKILINGNEIGVANHASVTSGPIPQGKLGVTLIQIS